MNSLFTPCPCCNGSGLLADAPVPSAPARLTDPDTSHAASKTEPDLRRFKTNTHKANLLTAFDRAGLLTAQEAAINVVGSPAPISRLEGCRRRVSDLARVNYITDSGQRAENAGSGTDSILWTITLLGQNALSNLNTTGWSR
jgi:hypothetical protein